MRADPRRVSFARLLSVLTALSVGACAAGPLPLLPPLLGAEPPTVALRPVPSAAPAFVHVTLRAGERAADVARAFGLPETALGVDPDAPQPAGAVLKVPLRGAPPALPPGIEAVAVREGDTLAGLAAAHGVSVVDLVGANLERESLDDLRPGERLLVPRGPRGLVVRLKPGQNLLSLSRAYGLAPAEVAAANRLAAPHALRPGDLLLLPGVRAEGRYGELVARRARERENELKRARLEQYQKYLVYRAAVEKRKLQEKYEAQARYERYRKYLALVARKELQKKYERQAEYERYQAFMNSPERRAKQAAYERQAKYERFLADQRARAAERARVEAAAKAERERAARIAAEAQAARGGSMNAAVPSGRGVTRATGLLGGTPLRWPVPNARLTSRFGERDIEFHRQFFHGGIDLAAPTGTPIYASLDGVVEESGPGDFGVNVIVRSEGAQMIYGHMVRTAVAVGTVVKAGDLLGYVGCTGICTGPHLHLELRVNGEPVDPLPYLQ